MPGTSISEIEISLVTGQGFWLLVGGEELFASYADFPWFRQATVEQVTTVELLSEEHLYWPLLDVDLAVASIRDPAAFPLVAKSGMQAQQAR